MDKSQALYHFWSRFGWEAIDELSSYDKGVIESLEIQDRYITYEEQIGSIGETHALTASLWHRSTSWAEIESKAAEIYAYLGEGGVKENYDGGQIWITRQNYRRMPDEGNYDMRRILFNINAEYLSA